MKVKVYVVRATNWRVFEQFVNVLPTESRAVDAGLDWCDELPENQRAAMNDQLRMFRQNYPQGPEAVTKMCELLSDDDFNDAGITIEIDPFEVEVIVQG